MTSFAAISIRSVIVFIIIVLWVSVGAGMQRWENVCVGFIIFGIAINEISAAIRLDSANWPRHALLFGTLTGSVFCLLRQNLGNDFYTVGAGVIAVAAGSMTYFWCSGSQEKWWRVLLLAAGVPVVACMAHLRLLAE
jgi:hypothetical protein